MFGRRMKVGRFVGSRRRGRRATPFSAPRFPFLPAATGVEDFWDEEEAVSAPFVGPTRSGEQIEMFSAEDVVATIMERPVLNRRQFIKRYQMELKEAYHAACARLKAMGRECPNYARLAKLAHGMYRDHRKSGSGKSVLKIIQESSEMAWSGGAPIILRRMEKTYPEFQREYKDLINAARPKGVRFSSAASAAYHAYKVEPNRVKALEAARQAILKLRRKKVATPKKTSKARGKKPAAGKPKLTKTKRTAMRKPPGVRCSTTAGRRAAEQQFTIGPTKLKEEIPGESKDTLLYRLQAEMSSAGKRRPRVVSMLKKALSQKGMDKLPAKFEKPLPKATKSKTKSKAKAKKSGTKKGQPRKTARVAFAKGKSKSVEERKRWLKANKDKVSKALTQIKGEKGKAVNWVSAANHAFVKCSASPSQAEIKKVVLAGLKSKSILYVGEKRKGTAAGAKRKTARKAYAKKPSTTKKKKTKAKAKAKPKTTAKPKKRAASKAKTKPHKAAESKAKRAKGKIATDKKNLTKAKKARDAAAASKKPAARTKVKKVEAKLKKDKKELASAEKSVKLHKSKAAGTPSKSSTRKAPTKKRTTRARAGKSLFRVKGNITVSA